MCHQLFCDDGWSCAIMYWCFYSIDNAYDFKWYHHNELFTGGILQIVIIAVLTVLWYVFLKIAYNGDKDKEKKIENE